MCRTVSFGGTDRWVGNAGFDSLLLKMWANGSFLFPKLDIKSSSQSNPAVMVQLRGEATGTSSFSITVKSLSIMPEETAENFE